jgi:ABC-type antimicrobial peptide transport system permease subunit
LLFTLSGIYGVVTWTVAQRTREIGIRVAMGASIRAVVRLVAGQCAQLAVWGIAIGTALALGAAKVLSTQVLLNPFDGIACSGGVLGALAACVAAGLLAARRVARIDPGVTLRYD